MSENSKSTDGNFLRCLLAAIIILVAQTLSLAGVLPEYGRELSMTTLAAAAYLFLNLLFSRAGKLETESKAPETARPKPAEKQERDAPAEVITFLSFLQQKGRFIDFVMDDITPYSDAQVGAGARVVHQGCRAFLKESLAIEPVHDGKENSEVTLEKDYDAAAYRLSGKVDGEPPFKGTLGHKGWKVTKVNLPERVEQADQEKSNRILAPAQVEIK